MTTTGQNLELQENAHPLILSRRLPSTVSMNWMIKCLFQLTKQMGIVADGNCRDKPKREGQEAILK